MVDVTFRSIAPFLAQSLISFSLDRRNLGKSIEIENKIYTFDYVSRNTSAFFKSRGLSIYFTVDRSVIRISDHWASSHGFDRSGKLNCVSISGKAWHIGKGAAEIMIYGHSCGKYPFRSLAGIAAKSKLNCTCDHWKG